MIFQDRADAGKQLAAKLSAYAGPQTRVLALPRGGLPIGYEVSRGLRAPLDVFVVRKIGAPGREELALGAIASGGVRVLNEETIAALGVDDATLDTVALREQAELERREAAYRVDAAPHDVAGRTVILVDDGLATGASMSAAVLAVRTLKPKEIVVAVPVAPADTVEALSAEVDDIVCLAVPRPFRGVGAWYADFRQVTDEEVRTFLRAANERA